VTDSSQIRRIALLPGVLINQIAAGEVIERPASVVKELIENCIDANASRIDVDIHGGGIDRILVRDNGNGIHPDDMKLAVMRHSTSKLGTREELETVMSLGFRGEALSSIASVSDFSITSRIASQEHGWRLQLNSGTEASSLAPAAHPSGTTVVVNNLFQSVPARRKFLRSDRTEFLHILEIVKRLVMSRFEIDISLRHNDKPVLHCPAVESDYRVRIKPVMGSSFYNDARQIDAWIDNMHLWGWLGGDKSARSQSDRQYLYLNKRIIRDRQLNHAIRLALEDRIPVSRYPSYILHLALDPATVDINVHPAKHEVRFRQPRDVHDFIYAALRDSLQQEQLAIVQGSEVNETREMQPDYYRLARAAFSLGDNIPAYAAADNDFGVVQGDEIMPVAIMHGRYILGLKGGEYRIIDFKNLKRYYLFTRLQQDITDNAVKQRPILVPFTLDMSESDLNILARCQSLLARLGLTLEESGPRSVIVRSIPALLPDLDINNLLAAVIAAGKRSSTDTDAITLGSLLALFAEHASDTDLDSSSSSDIRQQLALISQSGLSVSNQDYPGLWRTLTGQDLQRLIEDGQK